MEGTAGFSSSRNLLGRRYDCNWKWHSRSRGWRILNLGEPRQFRGYTVSKIRAISDLALPKSNFSLCTINDASPEPKRCGKRSTTTRSHHRCVKRRAQRYSAAIVYNVPRRTLYDRVRGNKKPRNQAHERDQNLTPTEEKELVRWITLLTISGYPPRYETLMRRRNFRGVLVETDCRAPVI
jgi:hypothetical protein